MMWDFQPLRGILPYFSHYVLNDSGDSARLPSLASCQVESQPGEEGAITMKKVIR